jgi:hypothetical protein
MEELSKSFWLPSIGLMPNREDDFMFTTLVL